MADTTAQYRHGILIGNWNEDQAGCELAEKPRMEDPPVCIVIGFSFSWTVIFFFSLSLSLSSSYKSISSLV